MHASPPKDPHTFSHMFNLLMTTSILSRQKKKKKMCYIKIYNYKNIYYTTISICSNETVAPATLVCIMQINKNNYLARVLIHQQFVLAKQSNPKYCCNINPIPYSLQI